MAQKKPERPILSVADQATELLKVLEQYLGALAECHDAEFFADQEEAQKANAEAEAAYSKLREEMAEMQRTIKLHKAIDKAMGNT
jgi:hypothetical protein